MKRRQFIQGLIAAPVVITTPGLLMPVKKLIIPHSSYQDLNVPQINLELSDPHRVWSEWVISNETKMKIHKEGF